MRHLRKVLLSGMIIGWLFLQFGCQPISKRRAPVQNYMVKIISDAEFIRTRHGEYVDGYLVEYELRFQKEWMFIVLEIQRYRKGDRLVVSGGFTDDHVHMPLNGQNDADISVLHVQNAKPAIPWNTDTPPLDLPPLIMPPIK